MNVDVEGEGHAVGGVDVTGDDGNMVHCRRRRQEGRGVRGERSRIGERSGGAVSGREWESLSGVGGCYGGAGVSDGRCSEQGGGEDEVRVSKR